MAGVFERNGVWWVDFRDREGKRVRKSTGLKDKHLALALSAEVDAILAGQERVEKCVEILRSAGALEALDWRLPIEGMWGFYEQHAMRQEGERTERERRAMCAAFVKWLAESHPEVRWVHEVGIKVCHQFLVGKREEGASASTVNNWRARLKKLWDQVRVPAGLSTNPWDAVERARGEGVSYRPVSMAQYRALVEAADVFAESALDAGFWSCAIRMAVVTGLRAGDIACLRWESLKKHGEYLVLLPSKVKGYGDAHVTVHRLDAGWAAFLPDNGPSEYVWPRAASSDGMRRLIGREFKVLAESVGIEVERDPLPNERRKGKVKLVTFHSLRKMFATELLRKGAVTADDLVAQGNWSSRGTVDGHYNFARMEQAKDAADKVAAEWEEILKTGWLGR